jgi:hypothetical protein
MADSEITHIRGDTLQVRFTIASDITGWAPRWTLKPSAGWSAIADVAATLTATSGSGLTVVQQTPTGIIDLLVAASAMTAIDPDEYVWDLQLTSGIQVRTVFWSNGSATGTLTILPDVTRTP